MRVKSCNVTRIMRDGNELSASGFSQLNSCIKYQGRITIRFGLNFKANTASKEMYAVLTILDRSTEFDFRNLRMAPMTSELSASNDLCVDSVSGACQAVWWRLQEFTSRASKTDRYSPTNFSKTLQHKISRWSVEAQRHGEAKRHTFITWDLRFSRLRVWRWQFYGIQSRIVYCSVVQTFVTRGLICVMQQT